MKSPLGSLLASPLGSPLTSPLGYANELRKAQPDDLRRGGRRLLQQVREMAAQDMASCTIRALEDRRDVRLIDGDGLQAPGSDWSVMEVLAAILYLRKEILRRDDWGPEHAPGAQICILDPLSGLLPPGMSALRCAYGLGTPPDLYLELHVLTEAAAQAGAPTGVAP